MNSPFKISLLSEEKSEILGYIIKSLINHGIPIHSVVLDSKLSGDKEKQIWEERTCGLLPRLSLDQFTDVNFYHKEHMDPETAHWGRESSVDLLLNAGTPHIIKRGLLDAVHLGVLNCHPGILPDFRGCTCVEWAIFYDKEIGNTVHFMTEKIDVGPIVFREGIEFSKSDQYHDIRVKVYQHGFDLYARAIKKIMDFGYLNDQYKSESGGKYYKVIDDLKMKELVEKVKEGKYKYQF